MAVFNADMQGEGRGSFLCLLGVCLIAIAAAAALDPWSLGSALRSSQIRRVEGSWSGADILSRIFTFQTSSAICS